MRDLTPCHLACERVAAAVGPHISAAEGDARQRSAWPSTSVTSIYYAELSSINGCQRIAVCGGISGSTAGQGMLWKLCAPSLPVVMGLRSVISSRHQ